MTKLNGNFWIGAATLITFAGIGAERLQSPDLCSNFSGYAGCSSVDPKYIVTKNVIEGAEEGPLLHLKEIIDLCKNTKRPSRKDFHQPYIEEYNFIVKSYLKQQKFPEAFAVTAAFLTLNFNFNFFIQHSSDFRKRSIWREVLIAERNYTAIFDNANEVKKTVRGLQMSDGLVEQVLKFEHHLCKDKEEHWDLISFADNHYFNAYLEYAANNNIFDSSLLNETFVYYAPRDHPEVFAKTSPEVIQAYLKAVVYKIIGQKYEELVGFDCNEAVQHSWPRTVSKLLEQELLPVDEARENLDERIENVFYDLKFSVVELLHELDLKDPELNQKLLSVIPDLCIEFKTPKTLDKLSEVVETLNAQKPDNKWGVVKALAAYKINADLSGTEKKLSCYPLRLSANILTHFKWTDDLDDPTFYATVGYEIAKLLWNCIGKASKRSDFDKYAEKQAECIQKEYITDKFLATERSYEYLALITSFSAFQHRQTYSHKPTIFSSEAKKFFLSFQKERKCSERGTPIHVREFYGFINQFECSSKPHCSMWQLAKFEVFVEPEHWSIKLNPPLIDQNENAIPTGNYIEERLDVTNRPCLDFFKYTSAGMPLSLFNRNLATVHENAIDYIKNMEDETKQKLIEKVTVYTDLIFDSFMEHLFSMNTEESLKQRNLKKLEEFRRLIDWKKVVDYVVKHGVKGRKVDNTKVTFTHKKPSMDLIEALLIGINLEQENSPPALWFGRFGNKIGKEIGRAFDLFGSHIFDLKKDYNISELSSNELSENITESAKCLNTLYKLGVDTLQCNNNEKCLQNLWKINEIITDIQAIQSSYRAHRIYIMRYGPGKRPPGELVSKMTTEQLFFVTTGQFLSSQNQNPRGLFHAEPKIRTDVRVKAALSNFPLFAMAFNCPIGTEYRSEKHLECNVFSSAIEAKNRYPFDALDF
ncbi:unnamed protein product [Bursaphelenchus okinawaensis]|uniref:Peptidase M13 C-terminal domain-containing protein n=1 Tax=Bursaphelenchus okinawaensis TaxID=465554 RepID=A0A811KM16_9BILA|nr:unnamed protein product [Bursaphelenchus okinawaensis]CAG9105838.1 unnamed protein product [Bursaphelenchus okinawaensis]